MAYTAVSLFTGAGGMDTGFSRAGIKVLWANDIMKDACDSYANNHEGVVRCGDINSFLPELETYKGVDIVFGGPPCQGFSVAGKMDPNDARSKLVFKFMDVVEKLSPKAFVMENVSALGLLDKWKNVREALLQRAVDLGYTYTQLIVLNAVDFGVPQKRKRMFLIGIKGISPSRDGNMTMLDFLAKYKRKAPHVGEVIRSLGTAGSAGNSQVCNAKISFAKAPILRKSPYAGMLFNGAGRPIDPTGHANTLPASMGGNKTPIIDENQVFNGGPSWIEEYHRELLAGASPKTGIVPEILRRLTVDEAALIQTFPRSYKFSGKRNSIYTQIGNAVPPDLAYAVALSLKDMLENQTQLKHLSVRMQPTLELCEVV